ncbi:MAG: Gfo/Idh/MocA family oxidoreductase [Candidatus Babeliaceae bacterium]|jgi:predicted dehydrogenase
MKEKIFINLVLGSLVFLAIFFLSAEYYKHKKPKAILIGAAGKQGQEYFNLLKNDIEFMAFVVSPNTFQDIEKQSFLEAAMRGNIKIFVGIEELKQAISNNQINFEVAFIAIPHHLHEEFTTLLLRDNKIIIKEKPLALNSQEVVTYEKISKIKQPPIFTIVQRHFQASLIEAKKDLHLIGRPLSFSYEYCFNLPMMTPGWRANRLKSGGGVLIDMGYHIIDVVNDFFGMPIISEINATFGFCYNEMFKAKLEDKAIISFNYPSGLKGEIKLSRHDFRKEEFIITGALGVMRINAINYVIYDLNGNVIKSYESTQTKSQNKLDMLNIYLKNRHNEKYIDQELKRHKNNVYIIDQIYKVAQLNHTILPIV